MPKIKKGFKVDRLKAKNDPAKLRKGRRGKEAAARAAADAVQASSGTTTRPKVIKFDTDSMKDYITGFHIRKNARRMQAMRKAKDDHRAQVNSERKERRESRRQVYNTISQFPINEDFKLVMPGDEEADGSDDEDMETSNYRESYAGQHEDSMVDVEVEELDLGGATGTVRMGRVHDSDDDDDDDDSDDGSADAPINPLFASSAAFPTNGAPTKVRLVRKKR